MAAPRAHAEEQRKQRDGRNDDECAHGRTSSSIDGKLAVGRVQTIDDRHDDRAQHHPHDDPGQHERHAEHQRLDAIDKRNAEQNADERQRGEYTKQHGATPRTGKYVSLKVRLRRGLYA